jgi:hypothetical protein
MIKVCMILKKRMIVSKLLGGLHRYPDDDWNIIETLINIKMLSIFGVTLVLYISTPWQRQFDSWQLTVDSLCLLSQSTLIKWTKRMFFWRLTLVPCSELVRRLSLWQFYARIWAGISGFGRFGFRSLQKPLRIARKKPASIGEDLYF